MQIVPGVRALPSTAPKYENSENLLESHLTGNKSTILTAWIVIHKNSGLTLSKSSILTGFFFFFFVREKSSKSLASSSVSFFCDKKYLTKKRKKIERKFVSWLSVDAHSGRKPSLSQGTVRAKGKIITNYPSIHINEQQYLNSSQSRIFKSATNNSCKVEVNFHHETRDIILCNLQSAKVLYWHTLPWLQTCKFGCLRRHFCSAYDGTIVLLAVVCRN